LKGPVVSTSSFDGHPCFSCCCNNFFIHKQKMISLYPFHLSRVRFTRHFKIRQFITVHGMHPTF
jgi:hypothetical protein